MNIIKTIKSRGYLTSKKLNKLLKDGWRIFAVHQPTKINKAPTFILARKEVLDDIKQEPLHPVFIKT